MSTPARQARREDRRDTILDVASECFVADGYGSTSMSTIAARLGGSKGTLYNYFKSKEELFEAFVRRTCARLQESMVANPGEGDARDRLVKMATAFLAHLLSPDAIAIYRLAVGEGERFPELSRLYYEAGPRIVIGRTAEVLESLMDEGVLRRADPTVTAHHFFGLTVSGNYFLRLLGVVGDPTPAELADRAAASVDTFLRAYAP